MFRRCFTTNFDMSLFAKLSTTVGSVSSLFSRLAVSESMCKVSSASLSALASGDGCNRNPVLHTCGMHPVHVSKRFRNRKILSWPTDYLPYEWSYPLPKDVIAQSGTLIVVLHACNVPPE